MPKSARHAPVTSPTYPLPTTQIFIEGEGYRSAGVVARRQQWQGPLHGAPANVSSEPGDIGCGRNRAEKTIALPALQWDIVAWMAACSGLLIWLVRRAAAVPVGWRA